MESQRHIDDQLDDSVDDIDRSTYNDDREIDQHAQVGATTIDILQLTPDIDIFRLSIDVALTILGKSRWREILHK